MSSVIADTAKQDRHLPINKRNRLLRMMGIGLLLLTVAAYAVASLLPTLTADRAVERRQMRVSTVVRGDLERDVMAQGRVVVANSPILFSPESGYVELYVKAGDKVQENQRLAVVVSPELGEQLAREKSELTRMQVDLERQKIESQQRLLQQQHARVMAEVQLNAMQREKRRADKSYALEIISQLDYEKVVDDLERAQVEFDQAAQNLALSDTSLAFYDRSLMLQSDSQALVIKALQRRIDALEVISPVNGMVGNVQVNHRQVVAANQALISVVDLSAYEVEAAVPEGLATELSTGMAAEIQLAGQKYPGTVAAISPEVVGGLVTSRIRFADAAPEQLRQNQRLTARIMLENKPDTLMIERGPFFDNFRGHVFKIDEGRAHKIPVELGSRSLQHIEIIAGVGEGDTVIISSVETEDSVSTLLISD